MSKISDTYSSDGRECPYCGASQQVEGEDCSERERVDECDECGKKYHAQDSFSVKHRANPDCELNGEQHSWESRVHPTRGKYRACEICGKVTL